MSLKKGIALGLALALLAGLAWKLARSARPKPAAAEASPLYTGKEPRRKVKLFYPNLEKPGLGPEQAEIFATASRAAQAKQVLELLFKKPTDPALAPAFPGGALWREVWIDEASGLCVVDFDEALASLHPGGTSSEFATVYALVKTLVENFSEVKKVQVLLGGRQAPTLAGHLDLSGPLSPSDF